MDFEERAITRRQAVALLAGAPAALDRFVVSGSGAAVLVDIRKRSVVAVAGRQIAETRRTPPGSLLKPFVLTALLRSGKLRADAAFPCPGRLRIAGRTFDCSHPRIDTPMHVDTALAYSCNCFVARVTEQFAPGELAAELRKWGFTASAASGADAQKLQALGSAGIVVTVAEAAMAYRQLAANAPQPILQGLEEAVEFGTAQAAQVRGVHVAGKTGTAIGTSGQSVSWFAGFMPSHIPDVAIALLLAGRSGGGDAAPVAGRILSEYRSGRL